MIVIPNVSLYLTIAEVLKEYRNKKYIVVTEHRKKKYIVLEHRKKKYIVVSEHRKKKYMLSEFAIAKDYCIYLYHWH